MQEGVEGCDDANQVQTDACLNNCTAAACGDGFVQAGVEACDDGNRDDDDGCNNRCELALGQSQNQAADSCRHLKERLPATPNGTYWIDPNGGSRADAFRAVCDMTTDGGGWTLLSWTGNSAANPRGVPYPGLAVCPSLDCLRGSAGSRAQLQELLRGATELAQGQSQGVTLARFPDVITGHTAAGKFVYNTLAALTLASGRFSCAAYQTGVFRSLKAAQQRDGTVVYVGTGLAYQTYTYAEGQQYIWNIGVPGGACGGNGDTPGTWMGTWNDGQYGVVASNTNGAYSVWVK